jgi:hypothetical protein
MGKKHSFVVAIAPLLFLVLCIVAASSCSGKQAPGTDSLGIYDSGYVPPSMPDTSMTMMNVPDVTSPPPQMEAALPSADASDGSAGFDASDATACEAGQENCDGLCVSTMSDVHNCGQCGNACGGTNSLCMAGTCSCKSGFTLCGMQCVDLTSDSANCGICTYKCQGAACVGSLCVPSQVVHNLQVVDIGVDQTNVYFTAGGTAGGVYFKPFASASNPVAISPIPGEDIPSGLALGLGATLTHIYWVDLGSGAIGLSQVIGTSYTIPQYFEAQASGAGPFGVTADSTNLYWVDAVAGTVNQLPLSAMTLPAQDAGIGTAPQVLAMGQAAPKAIAVDGTSVYWVNYGSALTSTGSVNKVPIGGNNSQVVPIATGESQPNDIKVDSSMGDGYVYWVDQAQRLAGGAVKRAPIAGGAAPTVLAAMQGAPAALDLDAKYVYWTNYDDGTVQKVPRAGSGDAGTIVPLATMQDTPKAIAVDSVNVYWSNSGPGDIWKVAKGP